MGQGSHNGWSLPLLLATHILTSCFALYAAGYSWDPGFEELVSNLNYKGPFAEGSSVVDEVADVGLEGRSIFREQDAVKGPLVSFDHGVASGDPLESSVVLWTRVSPQAESCLDPVLVTWQVATSADFKHRVAHGLVVTSAAVDFTVKVEVTGLSPGQVFHYRFLSGAAKSPVGRTRTLPIRNSKRLRFVVASGASPATSDSDVFAKVAELNDLDAVIYLDTFSNPSGRGSLKQTGMTADSSQATKEEDPLEEHRSWFRKVRENRDVQAALAAHLWIAAWGLLQQSGTDLTDQMQTSPSLRAWYEYFPVRPWKLGANHRTYQRLTYGGLLELYVLDTRAESSTRGGLSDLQKAWLLTAMEKTPATWKLVASRPALGAVLSEIERDSVLQGLQKRNVKGAVFVAANDRASWARDLIFNSSVSTSSQPVAVEFVGPAATLAGHQPDTHISSSSEVASLLHEALAPAGAELKYEGVGHEGYLLLSVTEDSVLGQWCHTVKQCTEGVELRKGFQGLQRPSAAAAA